MPTLKSADACLSYDVAGSGDTLLFLHGVGSTRTTWAPQMAEFAGSYRVVALDCRGHGDSQSAPESISLEAFATDAAAVIEREGPPAHLCGLSMGAVVALVLWRGRRELVRSLVLADAWAYHPQAAAGLTERLAAIDSASMPELARARMPAVLAPEADPGLVERAVATMANKDKAAYRRSNEVLWAADLRDLARTVTVPVLVIVGAVDRITPPPLSRELAALIPGARLEVLEGAGHLSNEEAPEAFNAVLRDFLAKVA